MPCQEGARRKTHHERNTRERRLGLNDRATIPVRDAPQPKQRFRTCKSSECREDALLQLRVPA